MYVPDKNHLLKYREKSCRSCPFHENTRSARDRDIPLSTLNISPSGHAHKCFWMNYDAFLEDDCLGVRTGSRYRKAPAHRAGAIRHLHGNNIILGIGIQVN